MYPNMNQNIINIAFIMGEKKSGLMVNVILGIVW